MNTVISSMFRQERSALIPSQLVDLKEKHDQLFQQSNHIQLKAIDLRNLEDQFML